MYSAVTESEEIPAVVTEEDAEQKVLTCQKMSCLQRTWLQGFFQYKCPKLALREPTSAFIKTKNMCIVAA